MYSMKNKTMPFINNPQFCALCNSPSREQLLLITQLKKRLYTKYISEYREKSPISKKSLTRHLQTNKRLIQIVLESTLSQSSLRCYHQKYFNLFKKKIRCSNMVLTDICEDLILKLGNRNYQLDILAQQFNLFPKTITQLINGKKQIPTQAVIKIEAQQQEMMEVENMQMIPNNEGLQQQHEDDQPGNFQSNSQVPGLQPGNKIIVYPFYYQYIKRPQDPQ